MYIGLILMCLANTTVYEQNDQNCMLFSSPSVFNTQEQCIQEVKKAIASDGIQLNMLALDMDIVNIECYDVRVKGKSI